ncbi:MAG: PilZ domain-containing protein [Syntrophales bacterium]
MSAGENVSNNSIKKLYVDEAGMVTFLCSKCGNSRKQSVVKYRDQVGSVRLNCICGYDSEVKLEFRRFFRKDTELEGIYYRTTPAGHWGKMIVRNLSLLGCRFEMIKKDPLAAGEEIKIQFTLDNPRKSIIKKNAVTSEVVGNSVGCRFSELPGHIDSELGFYLRNPK